MVIKHGEQYKKVISLMGGFHQLLVLQKIIYKRHGCMGYKKWFTNAKTIAAVSIVKAIEGQLITAACASTKKDLMQLFRIVLSL